MLIPMKSSGICDEKICRTLLAAFLNALLNLEIWYENNSEADGRPVFTECVFGPGRRIIN